MGDFTGLIIFPRVRQVTLQILGWRRLRCFGVSCAVPAAFCIAARRCRHDSQPCSYRGGARPENKVQGPIPSMIDLQDAKHIITPGYYDIVVAVVCAFERCNFLVLVKQRNILNR